MARPEFVNGSNVDGGSGVTAGVSFTPGAGVNLVVATLTVGAAISGVTITYGGVPMTFLGSVNVTQEIYVYYLVNPPAGAATVTANWTTSRSHSLAVRGYKNVNTVSPFSPLNLTSGISATPTINIASNSEELVIDAVTGAGASLTVGAGQTQEYNTSLNINSAGSSEPGAATVTMSWSLSASVAWVIFAVPIRPQTSFFLMF